MIRNTLTLPEKMPAQGMNILLPEDLMPIQSLAEYRKRGGLKGIERAATMTQDEVIAEVKRSGVRGRGGAGFPAAVKWQGVKSDPFPTKYIVCNAAEGEPGTYKDRYLIDKNPYQLLEGLLIAAYAIGATQAFIGTKQKFVRQVKRLQNALKELEEANIVEKGFVEIVLGPDEYLFGEEKALLEVVDGRGALPRIMPPYMQGARYTATAYNPTVVNNVETLSHISHIMAKGADWFRKLGSEDTPGTMIFTLSGDVKYPGMYELPLGTSLRYLLEDLGGGPANGRPFKAVFSGVANAVITPDMFDAALDFGFLKKAGSGLGSAGFIVYDENVSMVKIAQQYSNFLARESCGQCVSCNRGCRVITEHLTNIKDGKGRRDDIESIIKECGGVTNQTRCYLPAEESILISSILKCFPEEFESYLKKEANFSRETVLPQIKDFDEMTGTFSFYPYPQ